MRSDKPYRRSWCTECLNAWQRARRAILKQEAEAWRARTKHGSKGGRRAAARGDWLRDMAPVAKVRHIRDANLKALYGISLPLYVADHKSGRVRGLLCGNCIRAIGLLDENP